MSFDVDLSQNFVVRFINIRRKKDGLTANFKVKGIQNGTVLTASIAVDLNTAGVDPSDSLETIIEKCSHLAVREVKRAEFQFEGLAAV